MMGKTPLNGGNPVKELLKQKSRLLATALCLLLLTGCGAQPAYEPEPQPQPEPTEEEVVMPAPEHYFGMSATEVDGNTYMFKSLPESPWNAFACYVRLLTDQYGLVPDTILGGGSDFYFASLLLPGNSDVKTNLQCRIFEDGTYTMATWFYGPVRFEDLEAAPNPVPTMIVPAEGELPVEESAEPTPAPAPAPDSTPTPAPAPDPASDPSVLPDFLSVGTDYEVSNSTTTYWRIYTADHMDISAVETYVQTLQDMGYTILYTEVDSNSFGGMYHLWEFAHSGLDAETISTHGAHVTVESSTYGTWDDQTLDIEFSHDITMDSDALPSAPASDGGWVDCPSCSGGQCTACGGRGGKDQYSPGLPREWEECWKCHGDGNCTKCDGFGKVLA